MKIDEYTVSYEGIVGMVQRGQIFDVCKTCVNYHNCECNTNADKLTYCDIYKIQDKAQTHKKFEIKPLPVWIK